MNTRIALISIIVEDPECTQEMNAILHMYAQYVIGRMGIPYREKHIALISVAIDATVETINALTGKLGKISGLSVKTVYSKQN